jgi:hypothetical protein
VLGATAVAVRVQDHVLALILLVLQIPEALAEQALTFRALVVHLLAVQEL